MSLLDIENLNIRFVQDDQVTEAVSDFSASIGVQETVAIVGESGCGKSVTAMSILRLLKAPPAEVSGRFIFNGQDIAALPEREMRRLRGNRISMIFQDPTAALNPVMSIGWQIAESLRLHEKLSRRQLRERVVALLNSVGIAGAERRLHEYPHQLSGGMRQRAMIGMALACKPDLLIADEPTTALDVTIQAQVLELMRGLRRDLGSSILLITHDFGVVAEMADRVLVMYAGRKVEEAPVAGLFATPLHPYTRGLLASTPRVETHPGRLQEIAGTVPSPREQIIGCAFAARCSLAVDTCRNVRPPLRRLGPEHDVACHRAGEVLP